MADLSLTILPETADDALPIDRLHERTFGPGRFARSAYRIREGVPHLYDLSFTARIGTLLVGSGVALPALVTAIPITVAGLALAVLGVETRSRPLEHLSD